MFEKVLKGNVCLMSGQRIIARQAHICTSAFASMSCKQLLLIEGFVAKFRDDLPALRNLFDDAKHGGRSPLCPTVTQQPLAAGANPNLAAEPATVPGGGRKRKVRSTFNHAAKIFFEGGLALFRTSECKRRMLEQMLKEAQVEPQCTAMDAASWDYAVVLNAMHNLDERSKKAARKQAANQPAA